MEEVVLERKLKKERSKPRAGGKRRGPNCFDCDNGKSSQATPNNNIAATAAAAIMGLVAS